MKPLTEGKRNIIASLLQEYDIQSAQDIQEALRDLLGGTIQSMLEAEMEEHLGYESYERTEDRMEGDNYRNGTKKKKIRSQYGEFEVEVPQDRNSSFDPKIVKKRQKDISEIDQKIINMYARGLTTRQISQQIEELYGFECSESFISNVTDKILQDIEDWQSRSLDAIYPILFIDAVHFSVREENRVKKMAAYVILGITMEGKKKSFPWKLEKMRVVNTG